MRRLWVITGVLEVDECATTTDGAGRPCPRRRPLVGVAVELGGEEATALTDRVGARTRTDEAGRFRLLTDAVERPPAVRLRIHLHDEWLAVSGPLALQPGVEEWMSIPTPTVAGPAATLLDLGSLTLREGAPGTLGNRDTVRRAATWYFARTALAHLAALGPELGFPMPLTIIYPATVVSGASGSNALKRTVYIHRDAQHDEWSAAGVLHQLMHLWEYQHSEGRARWLYVTCGGERDALERQPAIAFHEGFAMFATRCLLRALWSRHDDQPWSLEPAWPGHDTGEVELEPAGVARALERLMTLELGPGVAGIEFADVLRVFLPGSASSHIGRWPAGGPELGLMHFVRRAVELLPQLDGYALASFLSELSGGATG